MHFPHLHSLLLKIVKNPLLCPQSAPHRPEETVQETVRVLKVFKVIKVAKPPTNIASAAHQNFFILLRRCSRGIS